MHCPGESREKAMRPGPDGARHEEVEAGDLALDRARAACAARSRRSVSFQSSTWCSNMTLPAAELDLELGDELAADVVGDAGEGLVVDVGAGSARAGAWRGLLVVGRAARGAGPVDVAGLGQRMAQAAAGSLAPRRSPPGVDLDWAGRAGPVGRAQWCYEVPRAPSPAERRTVGRDPPGPGRGAPG